MRTGTIAALALVPVLLAGTPALGMYHEPYGGGDAAAGDGGRVVEVTLSEWRIGLSTDRLAPGRVVFRITNTGSYPHAFELEREGDGLEVRSATLAPGSTAELTVDLPAGRYAVDAYCPLPGHRERGMATELEVAG